MSEDIFWKKLLSPIRFGKKTTENMDKERTPFLIDYDRIIFSSSFRRLSKKTQVHPLTQNDHIHTRLAHSLEVSCVGRSLGNKVGFWLYEEGKLPQYIQPHNIGEIVQAACLAHDIGNPPFGHAGEDAIRDWFNAPENSEYLPKKKLTNREISDFKAFDGNAQGFRVITTLEMYRDDGGMRLTYPTLASVVKYPVCAHDALKNNKCKFNFYENEREFFKEIFFTLGLENNNIYQRHPLSYLTEAADDICYRIIDMEDARELKILTYDDIYKTISPLLKKLNLKESRLSDDIPDRRRMAYIRGVLINILVDEAFLSFKNKYNNIISENINPLITYCSEDVCEYMENAKNIFNNKIMKDPQKTALEIGSYSLYKRLMNIFIPAVFHKKTEIGLEFREQRALDLLGINSPAENDSLYTSYLRVIDFISGMTDNYATFISKQFSGT